jgi:hypothetical protein
VAKYTKSQKGGSSLRTLEFKVDGQLLEKDPKCDFHNIVAGSKNYLIAHFTFSDDWKGCIKVASFWRGNEEHAVLLTEGDCCLIPAEALTGTTFAVTLIGKNSNLEIPTNRVIVRQEVRR